MTLPPLVERELRAGARRPAFYWLRGLLALVLSLQAYDLLNRYAIAPRPRYAFMAAVPPPNTVTGTTLLQDMTGLLFLALLCWAFFKVFSEMDTDPILSRIVNGDDRKLQGSFYLKFAEAIALPLLTLGSTILPGGAARLLELAQSLFSHAQ